MENFIFKNVSFAYPEQEIVHAIGNLVAGTIIVPISTVLLKLESKFSRRPSVK